MELERDIAKLELFFEGSDQEPPEWISRFEDKISFIEMVDSTVVLYIKIAELKIYVKVKIPIKEIPDVNIKEVFLLSRIFQKIPIGVLVFKQQIVYANTFIEKIFEKPHDEIVDSPVKNFLPEEIRRNIHKLFSKEAVEKELVLKWIGSFSLLSGVKKHLLIIATSTFIDRIPFGIALFFDISREKNFLTEMVDLHSYDSITGLPNLKSALEFIENLRKCGKRFLVGLIDTDNFSFINDSFGIEAGDKVLKEFAERLRESFDPNYYYISKAVSDQFLIVSLKERDRIKEVKYIVNKVERLLEIPFRVNGHEIFLSVNIGFSFYPEHGDSVVTKAEIALKHAREMKMSFAIYSPDLEISKETIEILSKIKEDIKNNRINVLFQPKVDLNSGKIMGAEALMRLSVPPDKAIPVIIRYGLMFDVGKIILRKSLESLKGWLENGYDTSVAVNVSISQLLDSRFFPLVRRTIEKLGVPPEKLIIEITESEATVNSNNLFATIRALVDYGVRISIDDFGTGYSSLSRLRMIKAHELKIDLSFVKNVPESEEDRSIVKFIVDISKLLKMTSVAEGIERKEQVEFLRKIGCDEGQGYYFSPPISADEFEGLLKKKVFAV